MMRHRRPLRAGGLSKLPVNLCRSGLAAGFLSSPSIGASTVHPHQVPIGEETSSCRPSEANRLFRNRRFGPSCSTSRSRSSNTSRRRPWAMHVAPASCFCSVKEPSFAQCSELHRGTCRGYATACRECSAHLKGWTFQYATD
jgi:hypothetical protein